MTCLAEARPLETGRRRLPATASYGIVVVVWAASVWASTQLRVDPPLHQWALFAHLAALVAGLGAVLTIDFCGLLWLLGRRSLRQVLVVAGGAHALIWTGLGGLVATGSLLAPDLSQPWTRTKLALVLVLGLNGVQAMAVQRQMDRAGGDPPRRLLLRSAGTAVLSQVGWWGAAVVGFLSTQG